MRQPAPCWLTGLTTASPPGINGEDYLLIYYWAHQRKYARFALPKGKRYRIDIIDTWNMTVTEAEHSATGSVSVELPRKQYIAARVERVA